MRLSGSDVAATEITEILATEDTKNTTSVYDNDLGDLGVLGG